jgi:hypothetical protein
MVLHREKGSSTALSQYQTTHTTGSPIRRLALLPPRKRMVAQDETAQAGPDSAKATLSVVVGDSIPCVGPKT